MKQEKERENKIISMSFCRSIAGLLLVLLFVTGFTRTNTFAAANEVEIVKIDYDTLTIEIDPNGNQVVYYSDKTKRVWEEVLGQKVNNNLIMDISWISTSADYELNFKGDVNDKDIVNITLPKMDSKYKAVFNKVTGEITFTNVPSALTSFEWRKATSYEWNGPIDLAQASTAGRDFLTEMEALRVKGGSIIVRIPGADSYTDTDGKFEEGRRPSKEIKLSITKRTNGPNMTINVGKLTLPMKSTMEYTIDGGVTWKNGTTDGSLATVVPAVMYTGSSTDIMLGVRYTEVPDKKPYSKTMYIDIPGQKAAPTYGTDVNISYSSPTQMLINFPNASKTDIYEYTIVKPGYSFDLAKASWSSVNNTVDKKVSNRTAPEGSIIYIRKKGVTASTTRQLVLASAYITYTVTYPAS